MYIVEYPLHEVVVHFQRRDEFIHRQVFHLIVVELNLEVGGEVEFSGEVAQHALEEGVDGLHAEVAVVVQQQVECCGSPTPCLLRFEWQCLEHCIEIVVGVAQSLGYAVELAQYSHLHLLGGFVGECHGEDTAIALRIGNQQFDVFGGKGEGLPASRTRLIYS